MELKLEADDCVRTAEAELQPGSSTGSWESTQAAKTTRHTDDFWVSRYYFSPLDVLFWKEFEIL